jgi:Ca2+-binding EF-hand superfamily protein
MLCNDCRRHHLQDGEVDLWEFCVAIQKRSEGLSEADLALEIDEAFRLFDDNGDGWVDEAELRRIMQDPHTGSSLSEDEFMFFLDDLERHQMFIRNGGKLKLAVLRQHPFLS